VTHDRAPRGAAGVDPSLVIGGAVVAGGAAVAGYGVDPRLGLAVLALPIVVLVVASPAIGAALLLFALPLEELAAVSPGGAITLHKLLGIVVIGAWLVGALVRRRPIRVPVVGIPLAALVLWGATSVLWSFDPGETIRATVTRVQLFGLYLLVVNVLDRPDTLRRALYAHLGGCVVLAVAGLYLAGEGILQAGRAALVVDRQLVLEPNAFGGALILPVVVSLVVSLDRGRGALERTALVGTGVLCLTAIALTLSRGPMLALAAALLVVTVVERRFRLLAAGALVALPGLVLAGGALWERLTEAATLADRGAGRLDIWRVGWAVFASHPLAGVGLGCFPIIYLSFLSRATGISAKHVAAVLEKSLKFPHNIYVGTAAEGGLVGVALLAAILLAHLRSAFGAWRRLAALRHPATPLACVAVAALAAFVVEGATFDIAHRKYFWMTLGLATLGRRWLAAEARHAAPLVRRAA